MNTRGTEKVLFASDHPVLSFERCLRGGGGAAAARRRAGAVPARERAARLPVARSHGVICTSWAGVVARLDFHATRQRRCNESGDGPGWRWPSFPASVPCRRDGSPSAPAGPRRRAPLSAPALRRGRSGRGLDRRAGRRPGEAADRECDRLARLGASLRAWDEPGYPERLRAIADPPLVLAVRGRLAADEPAVAIVGARRASAYGRRVAEELAPRSGVGRAHRGERAGRGHRRRRPPRRARRRGRTVAVLATGIDGVYPRWHAGLAREVVGQRGAGLRVPVRHGAAAAPFPASQPRHQRARAGHRGGRGGATQRLAHHGAATRSSRAARCSRFPARSAWRSTPGRTG